MTAYVDASIVLRRILGQRDALREFRLIREPVASRLVAVECLRTLDRLRVERVIAEDRLAVLREKTYEILTAFETVEVTRRILTRAAEPTPTMLGTLDAIHLASAVAWRERAGQNLVFATHDAALGVCARAKGFRVVGLASTPS